MSWYATGGCFSLPFDQDGCGDEGWVRIWLQGVPGHIREAVPFLPPPLPLPEDGSESFELRAMVVVTDFTDKGTERSGQEYVEPPLVLSGADYARIPFVEFMQRVEEQLYGEDGKAKVPEPWWGEKP